MPNSAAIHHELISVIAHILLFFGISGLIVPLLKRIYISPVLGYLICGILIGPHGLAQLSSGSWIKFITISEPMTVQILGELGIISLMFMIGLELSVERLRALKHYIFGLGSSQIIITAVTIGLVASFFDNTTHASILIGASFSLSSTAIVMKLLEEKKLTGRPIGTLCFSILLMQDLAVIPILILASSFSNDVQGGIITTLLKSFLIGVLTIISVYYLGRKVLAPLLRSVSFSGTPEWLAAFIVFIVLLLAVITQSAGMSLALGAFMSGLLISETEFKYEVEVVVSPLKSLLLGIFFLSIGMMINIGEVAEYPFLLPICVIGLFTLKAIIIFFLTRVFKITRPLSIEASLYLAQPGEFALMILGVALSANLMPIEHIQFFLLVTVVSMMITPALFKIVPLVNKYCDKWITSGKGLEIPSDQHENNKIVIAGLGRVGQIIIETLEKQKISYIAFDHDAKKVYELKKKNFNVIYGDASKKALWHHIITKNVSAAIIAIDNHHATQHILTALRNAFPLIPIIVRAKDLKSCDILYDAGANHVVAETIESSMRIAALVMEITGKDNSDIQEEIKKLRNNLSMC